jgi:hypothetical protein
MVTKKINRGTEIAAALGAQAFLLRPGSRSSAGSWTPHRDNHLPESRDLLVETLKPIAEKAEQEGVILAMETSGTLPLNPRRDTSLPAGPPDWPAYPSKSAYAAPL